MKIINRAEWFPLRRAFFASGELSVALVKTGKHAYESLLNEEGATLTFVVTRPYSKQDELAHTL